MKPMMATSASLAMRLSWAYQREAAMAEAMKEINKWSVWGYGHAHIDHAIADQIGDELRDLGFRVTRKKKNTKVSWKGVSLEGVL